MMPVMSRPRSRSHPRLGTPGLEEIVVALADAFCMVPVVGRPLHWRSGHYELWADMEASSIHLRYRSVRPRSFSLTLSLSPGESMRAVTKGRLRPGGYRDLVAADERLDRVILDAVCDPTANGEPMCLGELLATQQKGRRGG